MLQSQPPDEAVTLREYHWSPSAKAWNERRHHGDLRAAWMVSPASWANSRNIKNTPMVLHCVTTLKSTMKDRWKNDERRYHSDTIKIFCGELAENLVVSRADKSISLAALWSFFWFVCLRVSSFGFFPTFSPLPQLDQGQSTAIHQPMTSFCLGFWTSALWLSGRKGTWLLRFWLANPWLHDTGGWQRK